jgi:hypothetical protein
MDDNDNSNKKEIYISTRIDAETNQMLIKAAKQSRRSKHNEMAVRLKDHLKKFINPDNK